MGTIVETIRKQPKRIQDIDRPRDWNVHWCDRWSYVLRGKSHGLPQSSLPRNIVLVRKYFFAFNVTEMIHFLCENPGC